MAVPRRRANAPAEIVPAGSIPPDLWLAGVTWTLNNPPFFKDVYKEIIIRNPLKR